MTAIPLSIRKNKLLSELALIESEGIIAQIEEIVAKEADTRSKLDKLNKGIRKGVTLEQMKTEQNYKGTSYAIIQTFAREMDLQEPIEELIAMI